MPVNSFENYILTWKPDKSKLQSPLYLYIARQMEQDILSGVLTPDTKLPPQRELADYLDVSLNTITRAYTECEKRGLIHAVTGRGTFVKGNVNVRKSIMETGAESAIIDLGMTAPPYTDADGIADVIRKVTYQNSFLNFFKYDYPLGTKYQNDAARKWLAEFEINATDNVLITAGSQNALTLILTSLFEAGDKIAVDQYTYPNFISLANMLHINLVPVAGDSEGMLPSELAKAINTNNIKGIYLSPTCSNPQAVFMPEKRRSEMADIIKERGLILIEDECYAFLYPEKVQPLFNLVENNCIYLTELNKSVGPCVRVGYICYDPKFKSRLEAANYNCNLIVAPLNAEIAAYIVHNNLYRNTVKQQRLRAEKRSFIFRKYFGYATEHSYYQWLELPPGISSTMFESLALKYGIRVYGSERFLTGDAGGKYYLRVSTIAANTDSRLEIALATIKKIISDMQYSSENMLYTI